MPAIDGTTFSPELAGTQVILEPWHPYFDNVRMWSKFAVASSISTNERIARRQADQLGCRQGLHLGSIAFEALSANPILPTHMAVPCARCSLWTKQA